MAAVYVDRQRFIENLEESRLLDAAQWDELRPRLPATDRGRVIARFLVQEGVLTRFQAENLLAGRTNGFVLGQYRILDELGRGGMGRVFKAEHVTMKRLVALKVLAAQLTRTDRAQRLFQREVRAAARLVHPHIVTAFDANRIGDRFFLVLEYIEGPTLAALVREQGPLPVGQACDFIRQAALGLQHAHALGMVHRDIKPSNLLIQPPVEPGARTAGLVKIADFGLARLADDATAPDGSEPSSSIFGGTSVVMGTPDYLSPEQGRDLDSVDIRSDIYSLGCTLYFALTGEVPFPSGTPLDKIERHSTAEPEPVSDLRPIVPPEVTAVIQRMMAKSPDERYQTPAEVAEALEPYSESVPMRWSPTHGERRTFGDLMADISGDTSRSVVGGTRPLGGASSPLSSKEIRTLRRADRRASARWLLFIGAAVIGFVLGALLIANSMVTKPWPP